MHVPPKIHFEHHHSNVNANASHANNNACPQSAPVQYQNRLTVPPTSALHLYPPRPLSETNPSGPVRSNKPMSPPAAVDAARSPVLTMPDDRDRAARASRSPTEYTPPALLELPPSLVEAVRPRTPKERKAIEMELKEEGRGDDRGEGQDDAQVMKELKATEGTEAKSDEDCENIEPQLICSFEESQASSEPKQQPCLEQTEAPQPSDALQERSVQPASNSIPPEHSLLTMEPDGTEPPTPPPESASHSAASTPYESRDDTFCPRCAELYEENDFLSRRAARLRQRLQGALETAQTHGQRLLRAAYQDKVRELTQEHAYKTTEMLNMQKKCFEDELEVLDVESQTVVAALTRERDAERDARTRAEDRFQREREAALEKTTVTMVAVQRKLANLHARGTRLEREKKSLTAAVGEKQVMIEVLASAAAAKDVERRRLDLLAKTQGTERERKDAMVEALQTEVAQLREKLGQERQVNLNLIGQMEDLEGERTGDRERHKEDLEDCKQQSKKESDRLGRLFTSMIQDFGNVQSDVSTTD